MSRRRNTLAGASTGTNVPPLAPMTEATALVQGEEAAQVELRREVRPAEEMLATVHTFVVEDDDSLALAAEALAEVKGHWRRLEERKKAVTGPLNLALREVRGWFAPVQDAYAEAEQILKGKVVDYHAARAEANRVALLDAAAAHTRGDGDGVQDALAAIALPAQVEGLQIRETWDFEVEDASLVPRAFFVVDDKLIWAALRRAVERGGQPPEIPGVRFFRARGVSSRSV